MAKEKICIGSDHAGFRLKGIVRGLLEEQGHPVEDVGPCEYDANDDYPDYAARVCEKILENGGSGILVCGTGQGMDRAANKFPGIQAAVCWDEFSARVAKEHGNVNVLCLGGRSVSEETAKKIVKIWLENPFANEERHARRINKIREIEKRFVKQ